MEYHHLYGPNGHLYGGFFVDDKGLRYDFNAISRHIKNIWGWKEIQGKHIRVQLEWLGLLKAFENGTTPCQLPYTFC